VRASKSEEALTQITDTGFLSACPPSLAEGTFKQLALELESTIFLVWFSHAARKVGQTSFSLPVAGR
jgi:hypothetical protein